MRDDVAANLWDSAFDFTRVVWPAVREWCGGGDLLPVEGKTDEALAAVLDRLAGIDGFQVLEGQGGIHGVRGIASRVQYGHPWASFTIREKTVAGGVTELQKRLAALKDEAGGWLLPMFTVQAYVTQRRVGELLYACAVRTRDLFMFIEERPGRVSRNMNADGSTFLVVWTGDLDAAGYDVCRYTKPGVVTHDGSWIEASYEDAVKTSSVTCETCQGALTWAYQCPSCQNGWYETRLYRCPECRGPLEFLTWCEECEGGVDWDRPCQVCTLPLAGDWCHYCGEWRP